MEASERFWGDAGAPFGRWACAVGELFGGMVYTAGEPHGCSVCAYERLLGVGGTFRQPFVREPVPFRVAAAGSAGVRRHGA